MGFRRSYLRWRAYTNGSAPCKVITSATSALSGASLPLQELWSRARVWGRTAKIARDLSSRALTCPIGIWSSRMCARCRPTFGRRRNTSGSIQRRRSQTLGEAGIIGKTKYRNWQKRAKGKTHLGAWQCAHCPFKTKCVSVEYPEMRHQVADLMLDDGNIEPLATRLREICRCTCRRSRSGAGGSKRGRILRHQCREDALSRIPRKGIVRRLRRGRSGLQVRHRLAAEASRHVLDCPWRQRHHRPALLPHQREVRGLLGTGSGGMINPSSHF